MKKIIFLFILLTLSRQTFSQIIDGYGIKGGIGISNNSWQYTISTLPDIDWDNKSGISIRAFADFLNFQHFQIEGEVAYSKKGSQKDFLYTTTNNPEGAESTFDVETNLEYFSVALMAKLKIELPIFTPYILVGPQINYLLEQGYESSFDVIYENYRDNVVGLTLGFGTEIKLLIINLIAEYRYEKDLKNNYTGPNVDIKNYSHTLLVGIKF